MPLPLDPPVTVIHESPETAVQPQPSPALTVTVPVPPALAYCDDASVNDAPFYVMGFVEGNIVRTAEVAKEKLTPEQRRTAGESLVDVMAAMHAVDVDAVGLGDLGRKEGYVERQLKRWYKQVK